jgi:hypothetical protein
MQGNPLVPLAQQQLAGQIGGAQATALQGQFNPILAGQLSGTQATTLQNQFNPVLQSTLSGSYLNPNPYLTQALQPGFSQATQSYQDAINQMRSRASASGRYGTNEALMSQEARAQGALANAITSQAGQLAYQNYADERARQQSALGLGANLYEQEKARQQAALGLTTNLYEQERARQQAAIGAAPGLAAQDYTDIAQLAQVGQTAEQYQQAALADAIQKFNYQQQQPYANLQSFLSSAYGSPAGMQTIQPTYSNPLAGVLGAALAGKALLA